MRARRLAGALAWVAGLAVAAAALRWAGRGALAPPPLTEPGRWASWLDARGPIPAGISLLRLAAVGALWYLALATLVGAALRLAGAASLVRVADRLTIRPLRRMLAGTMSLGLAASGVLAVAAPALRVPVAAAAAQAVDPSTTTTSTTGLVTSATVTMHRLSPIDPVPARPADVAPAPAPAAATGDRWTVRPGECFWSVAEQVLTEHWGRAPSDSEIVPYWRRLIEANRSLLVHRDNPDLILPGQVFAVPAP